MITLLNTVKPLNKDTFGTDHILSFVIIIIIEVVLFQR